MSLISSAAGNKRRRVDDSDADSDEDDEGFYKIINWLLPLQLFLKEGFSLTSTTLSSHLDFNYNSN